MHACFHESFDARKEIFSFVQARPVFVCMHPCMRAVPFKLFLLLPRRDLSVHVCMRSCCACEAILLPCKQIISTHSFVLLRAQSCPGFEA